MDKQNKIIENLQSFGLTDKEAKVYLANLELGPSSVQKIAAKAGLKRATTYVILESLMAMGLVSESMRGKKRYFNAESPEKILSLLDKTIYKIEDQKRDFKEILPKLKEIYAVSKERPQVKFYEGKEGLKTIRDITMLIEERKGTFHSYVPLDELQTVFPEHETEYTKKRVRKRLPSFVIYTRKEGPKLGATNKALLRTARYVPKDEFPINCGIDIYNDKVFMIDYLAEKPIAIMIESINIAKTLKAIFDLSWKGAEKYNKNVKKS